MNMRKIAPILLTLTLALSSMLPAKADDYAQRLMDKQYRQALKYGCEDIKVKDPATATILGLLPGGGSFYTGQVMLGIADVVIWPFSSIWDIPLANKKALELNKKETILTCKESGRKL